MAGLVLPMTRPLSAPLRSADDLDQGLFAKPVFDSAPVAYALFAFECVVSDYAGPIVTLRRTSDNVEQTFYAGTNKRLNRLAILSWAGTSEIRIKTWYDQVGNHDAVQLTVLNQPVFDWSGEFPMLYNTGTPFSLGLSNALGFGRNKTNVVIAGVGDGTAKTTMDMASCRVDSGDAQVSLRGQSTSGYATFARRVNLGSFALAQSTVMTDNAGWHSVISEALFTGNTAAITVDGVRTLGGNFGTGGNTPDEDADESPRIGSAPNNGSPWLGFIRAIAFYNEGIDTTGRAALSAALNQLKPTSPNKYIACWGDSLTAGGYPIYLRSAFGHFRYVHDGGVGGESTASIRIRMVADTLYDSRINCLEGGRNGFKTLTPEAIKADMDLMIAHVNGGRYVVGSVTPFTTDEEADLEKLAALNALYASSYGVYFLDMLPILQAANDGSVDDLSDIAAGFIPRSLRSDEGHLNEAGKLVKAIAYRDKIASLGY